MIIGISTIDWIGQLPINVLNEYFKYIDKLVVTVNSPEEEWTYQDKVYYRNMSYPALKQLMGYWGCCKAYPRKVLWSNHFAVQEIVEGMTPDELKRRWLDELRAKGLLTSAV